MPEKVTAVRTVFEPPPAEAIPEYTAQLVKVMMSGAHARGFFSGEMMGPCADTHGKWKLVHRFSSASAAEEWKHCDERCKLLEEFKVLSESLSTAENKIEFHDEPISDHNEVSTAIITDVRSDMLKEYLDWQGRIHTAQARRPGYRSIYMQAPAEDSSQWAVLLKFDSPESIQAWFDSDERQILVNEAEQFVEKFRYHHLGTSAFPGWIPTDSHGQSPPNWKTAMLVLLGLFPVVLLQILYVYPSMGWMHPAVRTFVALIMSVGFTSFISMPFLVKNFRWWIFPGSEQSSAQNTAKGIAIISVLYALQLGFFLAIMR